ncbi:hypothetical protein LEP1GSC060_0138 [Leptospira weilii serovar Ranarum str. ICFT]|uniref:Uncharacterized protein n=1 Tax=Leptospira weilii serovar Ranarum str. ICFT TaxID=1218598 RepID=N1WJP0_9LEPT|nr:hypothetical protein LEP1GSC060_0138 [Leptospira weilii serovar Ranarum str. ICFT]
MFPAPGIKAARSGHEVTEAATEPGPFDLRSKGGAHPFVWIRKRFGNRSPFFYSKIRLRMLKWNRILLKFSTLTIKVLDSLEMIFFNEKLHKHSHEYSANLIILRS